MTDSLVALLHGRTGQRGESPITSPAANVPNRCLVVLMDRETFPIVVFEPDDFQTQLPTHTLPTDGVKQRLGTKGFA